MGVGALYVRQSSFFHPLTFYLFFHAYSFTFRAFELYSGKWPMYYGMQNGHFYSAVRPEEFIRGLIVADAALILFALGSALSAAGVRPRVPAAYNDRLLVRLLVVILPVSFAILFLRRFNPDGDELLRGFQLFNVMTVWPIAAIALAVARFGFRWQWVALAALYLFAAGTQGYARFMVMLPVIMLMAIYLARQRHRWPRPAAWGLLAAVALIFPNLKDFGSVYQQRGLAAAAQTLGAMRSGSDENSATRTEMFFDQMAGSLSLADALDAPLLGRSYLAILTLPVPRALWPGKPSLGETAVAIAAPGRPFDREGRIVTVIGESYINFRYPGVFVIMTLLGFALTRFYRRAFSVPQVDPYKLVYIGVMATFLQVFRDGVLSLILFSVISMFPIFLYAFLNRVLRPAPAPLRIEQAALAPAP